MSGEGEEEVALVLVRRDDRVLLGRRLRGHGLGRWAPLGGHVQPGEELVAAAARELWEESGLKALPESMQRVGYLVQHVRSLGLRLRMHVFVCWESEGEPQRTQETEPAWFPLNALPPWTHMWPDDQYWLPHALGLAELANTGPIENIIENRPGKISFSGRFELRDEDTVEAYWLTDHMAVGASIAGHTVHRDFSLDLDDFEDDS
jgi:8-oxo-dGTP diphosphatase